MGKDSTGLHLRMVLLYPSLAHKAMQQLPTASPTTASNRPTRRPSHSNQANSHRCHMSTAFQGCRSRSSPSSSRRGASSCPSPLCLHNRIQGSTTAYPPATSQHSSSLQPCPRCVAGSARDTCAVPAPPSTTHLLGEANCHFFRCSASQPLLPPAALLYTLLVPCKPVSSRPSFQTVQSNPVPWCHVLVHVLPPMLLLCVLPRSHRCLHFSKSSLDMLCSCSCAASHVSCCPDHTDACSTWGRHGHSWVWWCRCWWCWVHEQPVTHQPHDRCVCVHVMYGVRAGCVLWG
jgi:hypothetical protein